MPRLENLVCPCHAVGHCRTKSKADNQEADIPWPGAACVCGDKEADHLEDSRANEEHIAVFVESVSKRGEDKDCNQIADPDGGKKQGQLYTGQGRNGGFDDQCPEALDTNTHANNSKIHDCQWPKPPIAHYFP